MENCLLILIAPKYALIFCDFSEYLKTSCSSIFFLVLTKVKIACYKKKIHKHSNSKLIMICQKKKSLADTKSANHDLLVCTSPIFKTALITRTRMDAINPEIKPSRRSKKPVAPNTVRLEPRLRLSVFFVKPLQAY
jgi:hypothetical protein